MKQILCGLLPVQLSVVAGVIPNSKQENSQNHPLTEKYYDLLNHKYSFKRNSSVIAKDNSAYSENFSVFDSVTSAPDIEILDEAVYEDQHEAIMIDKDNNLLIYASVIDESHMI